MTFMLITAALLTGAPRPAVGALEAFNTGQLYLLTTETCSDTLRDQWTSIPLVYHHSRSSSRRGVDTASWNSVMLELWNGINVPETNFTVRAGDEYLIYGNYTLMYSSSEGRVDIPIMPEELWTVLSHCRRPAPPSTGQISMEAWYPGLEGPVTSFVATYTPAMPVIQTLLERGRQAIQPE